MHMSVALYFSVGLGFFHWKWLSEAMFFSSIGFMVEEQITTVIDTSVFYNVSIRFICFRSVLLLSAGS